MEKKIPLDVSTFLFVFPALSLLLLTIFFPLIYAFFMSLFSWGLTDLNKAKDLVWFQNYFTILANPAFWSVLGTTARFVLTTVTVSMIAGFIIALMVTEVSAGQNIIRTFVLFPMIVTLVIAALMWRYVYDPTFGLLNYAVSLVSSIQPIGWLSNEKYALFSCALVDIWQTTPFVILVMHAGLLTVPKGIVDAARVDGLNYIQLIRYVVYPHIKQLILLMLIVRTMDSIRVFDVIYVMTKGGPGNSTEVIGLHTYRNSFILFRMGYGMAMAVLTLIIIIFISLFYIKLITGREK